MAWAMLRQFILGLVTCTIRAAMRKKRAYGEYDTLQIRHFFVFPVTLYVNKEKYMLECRIRSSLESDTTKYCSIFECVWLFVGWICITDIL